jgi:integrase
MDADGRVIRTRPSAVIGPCLGKDALTEKEAGRLAWENILSKVDRFTKSPASMMTLAQFVAQKFEPEYVSTLKAAGKKHYKYCLSKLIPAIGHMKLRELDASAIYSAMTGFQRRGNLGTQTLKHLKNALSAVIEHAKAVGHFTGENPCSLVRLPQVVHRERQSLSFAQVASALAALPSPVREMCHLSACCSLNVAELLGLVWRRVNLGTASVVCGADLLPPDSLLVSENVYEGQRDTVKASARKRIVPLPDEVIRMLVTLKATTKYGGPNDPVFSSRNGTPIDPHNVTNRLFRKLSESLGFKVNWHAFRHACATYSEAIGMPLSDRIALMGHANAAMTERYSHSDVERRRAGVNEISKLLTVTILDTNQAIGSDKVQ